MAKGQPIPDIWYRLDDSAVIYPINITMATQSLFRLTCELDDYVDEEYLLAALTNILPRFPTFNVQLRSGIFRHFFDHNPYPPVVREDDGILFKKINFIRNHYYLFRTTYFKKRISIDFFHALSDGTGAMVFMKGLVFEYLRLAGLNVKADNSVKLANEEVKESERGDGFLEYGVKYKLFGGVIGKMVGAKAYQIKGKHFRNLGYGLIEGFISAKELKMAAKKYHTTVTVYIAAATMLAIVNANFKDSKPKDALTVMIPINLRRYFPSDTLKNFTSLVRCIIDHDLPRTMRDYCDAIKAQLEIKTQKKELEEKLSLSSFMGTKWYTKFMPLFIKRVVIRLGKFFSGQTKQTIIVSNLGSIKMPPSTFPHITRFCFNSNVSVKMPVNVGVVSFNDNTVISFTRRLISTEIEKQFFQILKLDAISPVVISNFRELSKE